MSRTATDEQSREVIVGALNAIDAAVDAARSHMAGGSGCRPEIVDTMLVIIESLAKRTQAYKWPDPSAKLAQAASEDVALQKLIKRASQKTPVRASRTTKGRAQ
jgi:hypothetical protein